MCERVEQIEFDKICRHHPNCKKPFKVGLMRSSNVHVYWFALVATWMIMHIHKFLSNTMFNLQSLDYAIKIPSQWLCRECWNHRTFIMNIEFRIRLKFDTYYSQPLIWATLKRIASSQRANNWKIHMQSITDEKSFDNLIMLIYIITIIVEILDKQCESSGSYVSFLISSFIQITDYKSDTDIPYW